MYVCMYIYIYIYICIYTYIYIYIGLLASAQEVKTKATDPEMIRYVCPFSLKRDLIRDLIRP